MPLQDALAAGGALVGLELGHGDGEGGVVGRELGELLVGVAVKEDEGLADGLVGLCVDNGDVAGSLVGDGDSSLHLDHLAGLEGLQTVLVVLEHGTTAE